MLLINISMFGIVCSQRPVSPSLCYSSYGLIFPLFLLIPLSDSDRWSAAPSPPLSSSSCPFLCSIKQSEPLCEFPALGSEPTVLGQKRQWIFQAPEPLWRTGICSISRVVDVGQGHSCIHTCRHTQDLSSSFFSCIYEDILLQQSISSQRLVPIKNTYNWLPCLDPKHIEKQCHSFSQTYKISSPNIARNLGFLVEITYFIVVDSRSNHGNVFWIVMPRWKNVSLLFLLLHNHRCIIIHFICFYFINGSILL